MWYTQGYSEKRLIYYCSFTLVSTEVSGNLEMCRKTLKRSHFKSIVICLQDFVLKDPDILYKSLFYDTGSIREFSILTYLIIVYLRILSSRILYVYCKIFKTRV